MKKEERINKKSGSRKKERKRERDYKIADKVVVDT